METLSWQVDLWTHFTLDEGKMSTTWVQQLMCLQYFFCLRQHSTSNQTSCLRVFMVNTHIYLYSWTDPGWVRSSRTYYLSKLILWWCIPPALPRPPGCFLCFPEGSDQISLNQVRQHEDQDQTLQTRQQHSPIRPCPWLTCPRSFLVLVFLVGWENTFTIVTNNTDHHDQPGTAADTWMLT